ncbi:MAG TPA: DUF3857 domain-containing protein [Acidobacteriaceae bacterium]
MRFHLSLAAAFAAAAFVLPAHAQFQPPTQEELQMTSEPKAPGAAAIYLYREEKADDNLHYHSFAARIKVLTEKGKELATVEIPYERTNYTITDIKGRTIHADGTIIPLNVKPEDLVTQKGEGFQFNKKVFTLPSVEVGSILEYSWQLRYDDDIVMRPNWMIQGPYYVRKAHYSFTPVKDLSRVENAGKLMYTYQLPPNTKINQDISGKYTLDVSDVAAEPKEDYMPPLGTLLEQVEFYYTPYTTKEEFWKHEGDRWSKLMDHFAQESGGLKSAVAGLVAPGDSETVKATKLYDAVMALDNTDYTRKKSREELKKEGLKPIKNAEDVWKQKAGSSDEIALLYLAMLRCAGIKAYAMTVSDQDRRVFNPYFMSLGQLDDVLVIATLEGKEVALDPGERYMPFRQLGWKHTTTAGIRQSDKGASFVQIPGNVYKEASTLRVADITIDKDGALTGIARISMTGQAAVRWRHATLENDEDEVKKEFNEYCKGIVPDGVTADFDHFLGLEDYHSQLMGIVKLSGNLGTTTGKRVFLPGVFFESHAKHPFVEDAKRETPVDMHYANLIQDDVTYHLPDGYAVESLPANSTVPLTTKAAFQLKGSADKNRVEVVRTLLLGFTVLPANEYGPLRDFYQKVSAADQQQLVLTVAKTNAGN